MRGFNIYHVVLDNGDQINKPRISKFDFWKIRKTWTVKSHCQTKQLANFHTIEKLAQSNLTTNTAATFNWRAMSKKVDDWITLHALVTMLPRPYEVETFLQSLSARRNCLSQGGIKPEPASNHKNSMRFPSSKNYCAFWNIQNDREYEQ